jgi:hypothetical protein
MATDWRNVESGRVIPTKTYSDQPYIVKTDDGAWLCTVTTGAGHEGEPGQQVVSMRSTDQGRTWSEPVAIEPADGPEASYSVMFKADSGRIYVFYNHNTDRLKSVKTEDGRVFKRVDTMGYYVFKYSDDHGRSWSEKRHVVPVREFEVDRKNVYGGAVRFFWNVGRPVVSGSEVVMTLHKVGAIGEGYLAQSEGVFLTSSNLRTERDPEKIAFETWPEGEVGIRAPGGVGRIAEEHCLVRMSDGGLFCIYRTVAGYSAYVISRDGGRSWSEPAYMTYGPGGGRVKNRLVKNRLVKNPRAATFIWRCENGKYLMWFHNHGGRVLRGDGTAEMPAGNPFDDRNPVWVCGGHEVDGEGGKTLAWGEPEVLFYHDDVMMRMSYPDVVEEGGELYFTTTRKTTAYVLGVPREFLKGVWGEGGGEVEGAVVDACLEGDGVVEMPRLGRFTDRDYGKADFPQKRLGGGFSVCLSVVVEREGAVLFDTMTEDGRGVCLRAVDGGRVEVVMSDGRTVNAWRSDGGSVPIGKACEVTVIVDGGAKVILIVVDGVLCDGGDERQFGWGRLSPDLAGVNGGTKARVGGGVRRVRVFGRALRVWEAGRLGGK